jgi:hypothetical protein
MHRDIELSKKDHQPQLPLSLWNEYVPIAWTFARRGPFSRKYRSSSSWTNFRIASVVRLSSFGPASNCSSSSYNAHTKCYHMPVKIATRQIFLSSTQNKWVHENTTMHGYFGNINSRANSMSNQSPRITPTTLAATTGGAHQVRIATYP